MASGEASERGNQRREAILRAFKIAAWVVSLSVLLGLAAVQLQGGEEGTAGSFGIADYQAEPVAVDAPAPDFELELLSGEGTLRLSDLRGKVVVLNFWASWCSPCRLEAPDLQAAWVDYRDLGVRFLGADELDDRFAARGFVEEFGITYPSVFDPSGSLADDFGFIGLPATYVIDERGRLAFRFQGFIDGATLRSALDDVLARGG
jgi:cytochrome c biogenesis protein CcmG/thiol:disulfide interchange protein DsbE